MKRMKSKFINHSEYILLSLTEYNDLLENKEIIPLDICGDSYDKFFQRYRIEIE